MKRRGMKRVLVLLVIAVFMAGTAVASNIGVEPLLNNCYDATNNLLNMNVSSITSDVTTDSIAVDKSNTTITHRSHIITNDGTDPSAGDAVDTAGYKYAIVYVSCNNVVGTGGCTVKPYLYDSISTLFYGGTSRTVSKDAAYVVEVNGQPVYVSVDNLTGANGVATFIFVKPTN